MSRPIKSESEKAIAAIRKNDDEYKMYKKLLQKHLKHEKENDTRIFQWELGQLIYQSTEDAKKDNKHYGENFVERFSVALGYDSPSVLRSSARVYERWPEEKDGSFNRELKKILNMKNKASRSLSWTHLSHLYWEKDRDRTMELVNKCLENCWTAKQLHRDIQKSRTKENSKTAAGVRPPSITGNASDCIENMQAQLNAFLNSWKNSWFSADFNLVDVIKTEPASDNLKNDVDMLVSVMDEVVDNIAKISPKLSKSVDDMTKELNGAIVKKIRSSSEQKEARKKRLQRKSHAAKTAKV